MCFFLILLLLHFFIEIYVDSPINYSNNNFIGIRLVEYGLLSPVLKECQPIGRKDWTESSLFALDEFIPKSGLERRKLTKHEKEKLQR
jgi:hypothetical protein